MRNFLCLENVNEMACSICFSALVKTSPDFDLRFDKTYRWTASSVAEKNAFITCLWKVGDYLTVAVRFKAVDAVVFL